MLTRVPALDGIRALSIALVLVAHSGLGGIVPGGLGVTIFFVVSGFLITGQLLDSVRHSARGSLGPTLRRFYARRALRLLPASTVYVLVAGCAFTALGGHVRALAWAAALGEIANWTDIFTHAFDTDIGPPHPFVTLWSLAVEEQFYVVWPPVLLLLALRARRPERALFAMLAAVVFGALTVRVALATPCALHADIGGWCGAHPSERIGKGTDTRLDSLAFGAVAALLLHGPTGQSWRARLRTGPLAPAALLLLAAALLVRDPFVRATLRYSAEGAALAVLVPAATLRPRVARLLGAPMPVAVGRLSYGLYLWHWLALLLAVAMVPAGRGPVFVGCYAVGTAALALASWFGVERPMLRLRRRLGSNAPASLLPDGRAASETRPIDAVALA